MKFKKAGMLIPAKILSTVTTATNSRREKPSVRVVTLCLRPGVLGTCYQVLPWHQSVLLPTEQDFSPVVTL